LEVKTDSTTVGADRGDAGNARQFSDADVAKLALTGSGPTTASGVNLVSYPK
jgi:hypothetical protein